MAFIIGWQCTLWRTTYLRHGNIDAELGQHGPKLVEVDEPAGISVELLEKRPQLVVREEVLNSQRRGEKLGIVYLPVLVIVDLTHNSLNLLFCRRVSRPARRFSHR